jgi:hypothetical protein
MTTMIRARLVELVGLSALLVIGVPIDAKKPAPKPTQNPITQDCVVVDNIVDRYGMQAELTALVHNNCDASADVSVYVAFFDGQGQQLDDGSAGQNVAAHATWHLSIPVPEKFYGGWRWAVKSTRITRVLVLLPLR